MAGSLFRWPCLPRLVAIGQIYVTDTITEAGCAVQDAPTLVARLHQTCKRH